MRSVLRRAGGLVRRRVTRLGSVTRRPLCTEADGADAGAGGAGSDVAINEPNRGGDDLAFVFEESADALKEKQKKYTELAEELKVEADLRLEEDVRIVQANQEAIIESKKFANRSKKLELEERPYYVGEEEERLSPLGVEVNDDVVEQIVSQAREMPNDYLEARLITYGANKEPLFEDPNIEPQAKLNKVKKRKEPQEKRGGRGGFDEETVRIEEINITGVPESTTSEIEAKYNLASYQSVQDVIRYEEDDPEVRSERQRLMEMVQIQAEADRRAAEAAQKPMLGDLKLYETSDDEDLIKNLPKITQEVAGPQAQPYIESFTEDGEPPPECEANRTAASEDAVDTFQNDYKYDEFDEFRIRYGLNVTQIDEGDENPFMPLSFQQMMENDPLIMTTSSEEEIDDSAEEDPFIIRADQLRIGAPTQEILYRLHKKDPWRFTVNRLASLFELKPWKVADTIELKEDEKQAIKRGEETTNLEWWFVQDMMEYDYSKGDPIEIPYTQWMFGGNGFLTEKMDHRAVDEIDIDKYRAFDAERIEFEKGKWRPDPELVEFASQIIPEKKLDFEPRSKSRYSYVFTDLTHKKKDLFRVLVRDGEEGYMRNASVDERARAIKEERPHIFQYRKML